GGPLSSESPTLIPEMPLGPTPNPILAPEPEPTIPPIDESPQEPPLPVPAPGVMAIESTDNKGWRKSSNENAKGTPPLEIKSLTPTNRLSDLPQR
ncbi:MAG: hypothetical protein KDA84_27445, partial [Planctomycetaceae bacterium]|nr:hypothetical protein [Planctomycetaceae bacterium]